MLNTREVTVERGGQVVAAEREIYKMIGLGLRIKEQRGPGVRLRTLLVHTDAITVMSMKSH